MVLNNKRQHENDNSKITNMEVLQTAIKDLQAQLAGLNIHLHAMEAQE